MCFSFFVLVAIITLCYSSSGGLVKNIPEIFKTLLEPPYRFGDKALIFQSSFSPKRDRGSKGILSGFKARGGRKNAWRWTSGIGDASKRGCSST